MEIGLWMKHPVHAVKPLDSIQHAREIMEAHRINQLPVVIDRHLVGIITDRDVREASPSLFENPMLGNQLPPAPEADPKKLRVEMVMTPNVVTLSPHDTMPDAARLMRRERVAAIPIVENDRLVGLLTRSDVLDAFIELEARASAREDGEIPAPVAVERPVVAKGPAKRAPRPRAPAAKRPTRRAVSKRRRPR